MATESKELEQIRSFLIDTKKGRNAFFLEKRSLGAREILAVTKLLRAMTFIVESVKLIDFSKVQDSKEKEKVRSFFETISSGQGIDEKIEAIGKMDLTTAKLYIDVHSLQLFDAYQAVIVHAVMRVKLASISADYVNLPRENQLREKVVKVLPATTSGFEEFGDDFAYALHDTLLNELENSLRSSLDPGDNNNEKADLVSLGRTAAQAQFDIRQKLEESEIPTSRISHKNK